MKRWIFILCWMLALPLSAATTNYMSVVGKAMQGNFMLIDSTNTPCSPTNVSGYTVFTRVGHDTDQYFGTYSGCGSSGWWYSASNLDGYSLPCHSCVTNSYFLWLKADAGVYADAGTNLAWSGTNVMQWNDQSGNGYHFTQATDVFRPLFYTNVINGLPAIRFTGGVDARLVNTNISSIQPFVISMVMCYSNTWDYGESGGMFSAGNMNSGLGILYFGLKSWPPHLVAGTFDSLGASEVGSNTLSNVSSNKVHYVSAIFNTTTIDIRLDGVSVGGPIQGDDPPLVVRLYEPIQITDNTAEALNIAEVIISTDVGQVGSIEAYLKAKYGL